MQFYLITPKVMIILGTMYNSTMYSNLCMYIILFFLLIMLLRSICHQV